MGLLEAGISWLAPPECIGCSVEGTAMCDDCATSLITPFGKRCWRCGAASKDCRTCAGCRRGGSPGFVWICTNYESTARDLIRKYKFGHLRSAAAPIADMMSQTFLNANRDFDYEKSNYLIVPIPTATSRLRQRGFGHAELLAKNIAFLLRLASSYALARLGQSKQIGAARSQRIKQAFGQYSVKKPSEIKNRHILLIDDVVTTGGTLQAASLVLRQAGAAGVDTLIFAKRL